MTKFTPAKIYSAAAAVIVTGLTLASPLYAVPYKINSFDTPTMPVYATNEGMRRPTNSSDYQTPSERREMTPAARYNQGNQDWNVEDRIIALHQELRITQDQEPQWQQVANVMRTNDNNLRTMVQERHRNANNMNAVADLESFQSVAQAHVDGLQRLIPVFNDLYTDMSDAQRNQADHAFNRFEGRMPTKMRK